MKVCVVGLGYIGFPTACIAARAGHTVIGVDVNESVLAGIRSGSLHIKNENGLKELARKAIDSRNLVVAERPVPADVFIIAVPTPFKFANAETAHSQAAATALNGCTNLVPEDKTAVLSFVERACHDIGPLVQRGTLVILESTVPPGTTSGLAKRIVEKQSGLTCGTDFYLAHAPERVLPGNILYELVNNHRIIGGVDAQASEVAAAFYRTFVRGKITTTDATTSEMVKLMENTFRDVNIALANEFALIAERLGIDVFEAISLANQHPRVNFLKPGPGVGGHCIAVDPYFVIEACPELACVIRVARKVNNSMPYHVAYLVDEELKRLRESGRQPRKAAILGAAYKADVDDDRESPSLEVASMIANLVPEVEVHDPYVHRYSARRLEDVIKGADILVLLTDHSVYRSVKPDVACALVRNAVIVDTRHFFGPEWDRLFRIRRLGVGEVQ